MRIPDEGNFWFPPITYTFVKHQIMCKWLYCIFLSLQRRDINSHVISLSNIHRRAGKMSRAYFYVDWKMFGFCGDEILEPWQPLSLVDFSRLTAGNMMNAFGFWIESKLRHKQSVLQNQDGIKITIKALKIHKAETAFLRRNRLDLINLLWGRRVSEIGPLIPPPRFDLRLRKPLKLGTNEQTQLKADKIDLRKQFHVHINWLVFRRERSMERVTLGLMISFIIKEENSSQLFRTSFPIAFLSITVEVGEEMFHLFLED